MKKILLIASLIFSVLSVGGQIISPMPGQNPVSAFTINNNSTYFQANVSAFDGNIVPVPPCSGSSVTFNDINPFYYRMHCLQSGTLVFTITPIMISDDYDWQLFDATNKNPIRIYSDSSMYVTCNWSGLSGTTGTNSTATNTFSCEGNTLNFTAAPTLLKGHDYLLLVSHFTTTNQSGYTISFGGTAVLSQVTTPLPQIKGQIFIDDNNNGIFDGNDTYKSNVKVQLSNGNYTFTDNNGYYQIQADSIGNYTLTITPPTGYNALPQTVSYNFNKYDTTVTKDIALQQITTFDSLSVFAVPLVFNAVQGGAMPYYVQYENCGTSVLSPTVNLSYSKFILNYDSCTDATAIPYFNGIVTAQTNMQPGQMNNFISYYDVLPIANIGDTLKTNYGIALGTNIAASDSFYMLIEGASITNGQRATPSLTAAQVASGKDIYYTINFKNTGTDTAFNIVITDTLSSLLQANTLQMVSSSHKCRTTVKGNVVTLELLNIKLPQASANALHSLGFVSFKVKPKSNLTAGTIITNKANTYYNYRLPISSTATTIIKAVVTPVKLTAYSLQLIGDKKQVINSWTTATEINTSHFNVQRSIDGKDFTTLVTVTAKGFGSYEFTDNKLPTTNNKLTLYYRLEIVDKDGSKTYSEVKNIEYRTRNNERISIYPNPAKDFITIESSGVKNVTVTDCFGRVVYKAAINHTPYIVNLKSFSNGIYIFSFDNGEKVKVVRE